MTSEFDRLMCRADETLFGVFGENGECTYTAPSSLAPPQRLRPIISRNVQVAGADGIFRAVQALVEIRLCEVSAPRRGGRLRTPDETFTLEEQIDSDGLVERWTLLPAR